jgi:hypothetical protein
VRVRFWDAEFEAGDRYFDTDLRASNDILHDVPALRARLEQDGYLLIQGLRDRDAVLSARRQILKKLSSKGMLAPGSELMDGLVNPAYTAPVTTGTRDNEEFRLLPAVQNLRRMPQVMEFFDRLLGGPSRPFDFHWVRVAAPGAESAIHSDIVFMGRGTQQVYTCWAPLGDVSLDMGPIVLCVGTHKAAALQKYWAADVDRDLIQGWLSKDPVEVVDRFGGRWATTDFRAGDAVIFNMHILHGSLANTSNRYRISADARYQLASEPFDERWTGEARIGHYNFWKPGIKLESVAESRAKWGL